jgi:hypothetical protein
MNRSTSRSTLALSSFIALVLFAVLPARAQQAQTQIALLKYNGVGDWYANLETSLPNLIEFSNKELEMNLAEEQVVVEAGNPEIIQYPFVHMTGHGNVIFSPTELENLSNYLMGGGFLHIDDNYGMDPYIRVQLARLFPNKELIEIPDDHAIYNAHFKFDGGLPKIHEHDEKAPKAYALFERGRMICLYTYESDLGDGWEDLSVHKDSPEKRNEALKMGANILAYIFSGQENSSDVK